MADSTAERLMSEGAVPPLLYYIGSTDVAIQTAAIINWETDSTSNIAPDCGANGPHVYHYRFKDFTKGLSSVYFKGSYNGGSLQYGTRSCWVMDVVQ